VRLEPALPTPEPMRQPPAPIPAHEFQPLAAGAGISRRRDVLGWLGFLAGAAVVVAALAVPLDDPALVMALAMGLRGGRRLFER
jgi:hypothetical protein